MRTVRSVGSWLLVMIALLVVGCGDGVDPSSRAALGAGLQLDEFSPVLDPESWSQLTAVGVQTLWIDWARLGTTESAPARTLPRDSRVVLVVRGRWADLEDPSTSADEVAQRLSAWAAEAEVSGGSVHGFLLSLRGSVPTPDQSALLAQLRRRLGGSWPLGVELDRDWIGTIESKGLLAAIDFVVQTVYGEVREGDEATDSWELAGAEARYRQLADLGVPFVVGIGLSGRLAPRDGAGSSEAVLTLPRALLEPEHAGIASAFLFEGYHREILDVRFRPGTELRPGWMAGNRIWRLTRPTLHHVAAVVEALDRNPSANELGRLYRRPRAGDDATGLTLTDLSLLLGGAFDPDHPIAIEVTPAGAGSARLSLHNPGSAIVRAEGHNFVDIVLRSGRLGDLDPGGFERVELRDAAGPVTSMRAARAARRARLYFGGLDRGERIDSGLLRAVEAEVSAWTITAQHLTPLGEIVVSSQDDPEKDDPENDDREKDDE